MKIKGKKKKKKDIKIFHHSHSTSTSIVIIIITTIKIAHVCEAQVKKSPEKKKEREKKREILIQIPRLNSTIRSFSPPSMGPSFFQNLSSRVDALTVCLCGKMARASGSAKMDVVNMRPGLIFVICAQS